MTDNPAPKCTDPREIAHWRDNKCWIEDAELLAEVHKWRYLSAKIDAVRADPDGDFSNIHEMDGRLQDLQGRLARHQPFCFLAATFYLEIAAEAILKKQTDPDDAAGDLVFAQDQGQRVQEVLEATDGLWIDRRDAPKTDPDVVKINTA